MTTQRLRCETDETRVDERSKPRKLIEVALPLEAINKASARGEVDPARASEHAAPVVGAAAAGGGAGGDLRADGGRPLGVRGRAPGGPEAAPQGGERAQGALKLWEEARASPEGQGTGLSVPEPGPQPTLDEMLADQERQRLFRIIEDLVLWENTTNETVLQAARDEIWQSWRRPAPRTPTIRGRRNCSTARSCPPSTTPSPAAGRCRWRRSGSGWRATPAT